MTSRIRACFVSGICLTGLAATVGAPHPGAAQSYVVQPGNTLSSIAARAHRNQGELIRLNGLANPDRLQAGQVLTVPDGGTGRDGGDAFEPGRSSYAPAAGYQPRVASYGAPAASYRTRAIYQPARSVTEANQQAAYQPARSTTYAATQQVPAQPTNAAYRARAAVTTMSAAAGSYAVQPGDTLGALSGRFGVPLAALASANGIRRLEFLQIGQRLTIPSRITTSTDFATGTGMGAAASTAAGAASGTMAISGPATAANTPVAVVATVTPSTGGASGSGLAATTASVGGVGALLTAEAQAYRIDPALVKAVAWQESGWQMVVAADGGIGVMQLMPATAAWVGPALLGRTIDPYNLQDNVQAGVALLASYLQQYGGNVQQALAAYNEGPQNLTRGILPSTAQYIAGVLSLRTGYAQ